MAPLKPDGHGARPLGRPAIHGLTAMAPLKHVGGRAPAGGGRHPWPHGHGPIEANGPADNPGRHSAIHGLTAMAPLKRPGRLIEVGGLPPIHGLTAMAPLKPASLTWLILEAVPSMASRPWPH